MASVGGFASSYCAGTGKLCVKIAWGFDAYEYSFFETVGDVGLAHTIR